jgi:hypothetical protein
VANFTRVSYETCAWHGCGRLWVRYRERKGVTCSRECGQSLRQHYYATRYPHTDAAESGVHDTALCAWWEPPFCERQASKRDLCRNHYATARRRGTLPPTVPRRPVGHAISADMTGAPVCSMCGPIPYLLGGVRCPLSQREYVLREKYGLTLADYDERLIALGNRCAMCGKPPGAAGLVVDHSHVAGHPRDLICMPCNLLLGHVEGDIDRVQMALHYVDTHRVSGAWSPTT